MATTTSNIVAGALADFALELANAPTPIDLFGKGERIQYYTNALQTFVRKHTDGEIRFVTADKQWANHLGGRGVADVPTNDLTEELMKRANGFVRLLEKAMKG